MRKIYWPFILPAAFITVILAVNNVKNVSPTFALGGWPGGSGCVATCDMNNLVHKKCSNMEPVCTYCEELQNSPQPTTASGQQNVTANYDFLQNRCECDRIDVMGQAVEGSALNFTAFAKIRDPFRTNHRTDSMVFTVFKDGTYLTQSPQISTTGPVESTDAVSGETISLYQASWNFQVNGKGIYHLDVSNGCEAAQTDAVLGTSTSTTYPEEKSIKLGTFDLDPSLAQIVPGCRSADIVIP